MIGRLYFVTTLGAWRRNLPRFGESHFVAIGESSLGGEVDESEIFALITADESTHISLENNVEFEALPHPLAGKAVSERVAAALAGFGVVPGDDTFTVAEKVARMHPLLRHRVF